MCVEPSERSQFLQGLLRMVESSHEKLVVLNLVNLDRWTTESHGWTIYSEIHRSGLGFMTHSMPKTTTATETVTGGFFYPLWCHSLLAVLRTRSFRQPKIEFSTFGLTSKLGSYKNIKLTS